MQTQQKYLVTISQSRNKNPPNHKKTSIDHSLFFQSEMAQRVWRDGALFGQSFLLSFFLLAFEIGGQNGDVTNTVPAVIFCFWRYFCRSHRSFFGRKIGRCFPLLLISALPILTASAVINRNSETRMPVVQMVCKIRGNRSLPSCLATLTKRVYSARVNSFFSSRNRAFWSFSERTVNSRHSIKERKPLIAANMELTVAGA